MNVETPAYPPTATWVAAVHLSENDDRPVGGAVVIDSRRLLTCGHCVVSGDGTVRDEVWVAFPASDGFPRCQVERVEVAYKPPVADLAVLTLREPVPAGVDRAPLRCPRPTDLVGQGWWAFGFPGRDPVGNACDGSIGTWLGYGWIRLDTSSKSLIEQGFSGTGLWSGDYQAVVGIVGQVHHDGDGRAITMHQASLTFPDHHIEDLATWSAQESDEAALAQWGWALDRDREGIRHWLPRARGVVNEGDPGYRFRGRTAALTRIVKWLDDATADRRVLVVTGSPGVGKSAVLGRIVTTADADIRSQLPADDEAIRATIGSVRCAVHAKSKTADEVAEEIARAASARLPAQAADLAGAIREALTTGGHRFNIIIDALDEAASPEQARDIIDKVVLPLVWNCSDEGVHVVIGTRRRDDDGDLLERFGSALDPIDLDEGDYFAEEDLAAYALACLQLTGEKRDGNPYTDGELARPVADRIATMSDRNFLVAGLIARSHGLHDREAAQPERLEFDATVDAALDDYLGRLGPVAGLPASSALTALAFAEAPGLPVDLWRLAIIAIYGTDIRAGDLAKFARSSAANFLIESGGQASAEGGAPRAYRVVRLFHQALSDALLRRRHLAAPPVADQRAITLALAGQGKLTGWAGASGYLLRSLPAHADAAGLVDDLLADDTYLLKADLRRLMQVADNAVSDLARQRARLLRMTPQAITVGPAERTALFSVTEALEGLGTSYRARDRLAPYCAGWAVAPPRLERAVLEGHHGRVNGVAKVTVGGKQLLASAGDDATVQIWDPATGEPRLMLAGHVGWVKRMCRVTVGGRELLASAGDDGTVRIWDPATGEPRAILSGHKRGVNCVSRVTVADGQLVASAGQDGTIRLWDPATAEPRGVLDGHRGWVTSVCQITVAGQHLLASAGHDGTVRLWDPATGGQRAVWQGHQGWITCVCKLSIAGTQLLASAGNDRTVRIWDPETGRRRGLLQGHQDWVSGVCPVTLAGQTVLASTSHDRTIRLWDPGTELERAVLHGHRGWVTGLCTVTVAGRPTLASSGDDGTVRIWDLDRDLSQASSPGREGNVTSLCPVTVSGQELLAGTWSDNTIRLWDPGTGEPRGVLQGHQGPVNGVCPVTMAGRPALASASNDGTVRIWDPATGLQRGTLPGQIGGPNGVCAVHLADRELLAVAGTDHRIRIWDLARQEQQTVLQGHEGWVNDVCPLTLAGQPALASAGNDGTVRIWDLASQQQRGSLDGHEGGVTSVCQVLVAGQTALVSTGHDSTVRIWDPARQEQQLILQGHEGWVNDVCPIVMTGQPALASAGNDSTVRIWDPYTGACLLMIPTHYQALAVSWVAGQLAIGLTAGILVIRLGATA